MGIARTPVALTVIVASAIVTRVAFSQTFDVAAVRLNKDVRLSPSMGSKGGRFTATNMPVLWLISSAYDVSIHQISGLPDSFSSKSYNIEATTAQASRAQMMTMLQRLLEERFKLRVRHETKELSVYVLSVAKGGLKLAENEDGADLQARTGAACQRSYRNFPMSLFANILSGDVADTVVDRTALTPGYDFTLQFAPEQVGRGVKEGRESGCPEGLPSIFTALREQLGLQLNRQRTSVELLAVDHIEEPSAN